MTKDVVVVGAGISGMSCAMYLEQAGLDVGVMGGPEGSQLANAPVVRNYPGLPPMSGYELLEEFKSRLGDGVSWHEECISCNRVDEGSYSIEDGNGRKLSSRVVVIATGRRPRLLGIPGERELLGNGLSTCAYCDGAFAEGGNVLVVGGGRVAFDSALYLSGLAHHVMVVMRGTGMRDSTWEDTLYRRGNVAFGRQSVPTSLSRTEDGKTCVSFDNRQAAMYDVVFYAIGSDASLGPLADLVEVDSDGIVALDGGCQCGNGLYACGSVLSGFKVNQAVTAAASGAACACQVVSDLRASGTSC